MVSVARRASMCFHSCSTSLLSANWPEPWKYITFPDCGLDISVSGETVTLTCKKPIKGVVLDVDGEDVKWSDQAVDLMPGDPQTIIAKGLDGRKIKARFIGDGSA